MITVFPGNNTFKPEDDKTESVTYDIKESPDVSDDYIIENIDTAISSGWIEVWVQPIVHVLTETLCGFEALTRWNDPKYGYISPGFFVPILEDAKQVYKLDIYVVRVLAERYGMYAKNETVAVPVSVNFSRVDFDMIDVFETVESIMQKNEVPREMLNLEITESSLSQDSDKIRDDIARFRAAGYEVWIDDFGSGYSSLGILKDIEFDVLKIDMMFLRDMNVRARRIIRSIVQMAKSIGVIPLAEGVETREQLDFIKELGCWRIQGHYYGEPLPLKEQKERMEKRGIRRESISTIRYYDKIGQTDVLSPNPFTEQSLDRPDVNYEIPLAIVNYYPGQNRMQLLFVNLEILDLTRDIGPERKVVFGFFENTESVTNSSGVKMARFLKHTADTGEGHTDYVRDGIFYFVQGKRISVSGDCCAIMVGVTNLSLSAESNREKNTDNTLRQLYSVFYHVFVIDGNEMTASLVYGNETVSQVQNIPCDELFKRFGDSYVYSDDRQEYLTFTDLSTVDDRLAALGSDFCERYIRVKDDTGDVSWSLMTIIRTGEKKYIMTARKTSGESALAYEVFRKSGRKASAVSSDENPLWDSFRTGAPFGVFWKDRKRRYLGCNRYFLDYYGFESEDEIVGKTDEEIGWFIHPDKFREDELRVLRDGVISVNVSGSCITRGKVREIIMTEMPVRDKSGHITGVLGFFRDNQTAGLTNDEKNLLTNLSRTDDLSGLQNSVGMRIDYMHYEDEYRIKKTDFAEIRISITNFDDLENMYGSLFIEKVIRVVGDNLTLVCGRAASLSRLSGGEFVLLKQSGDKAEIEKMIEEINSAFTNAQEIDGISFTVFLKAEYSFYSEKEDENSKSKLISDKMMVETIIRRMFGNRFECMALINSHTMMMYYQYFGVNIPAERWQRYGDVRNGVPAAHVMEAASKLWVASDERERMYSLTKPNALLAEMADKDQYTIKVKVPNPNLEGAPLWKQMRFSWLDDEHEWILYDQTDITESVRLESAHIAEFAEKVQETQDLLEREQQHAIWEHAKAEALMQIPGTVSFDYNPESDVLEINLCNEDGSMENIRMSGYLRTENGRDWVTPEFRKADDKIWEKALRGEYRGSFEIEGCLPGKKPAWYKIILRSVTDSEGNVFRVVGRAENIQHYISTASKWRERATEDSLTGLLNHSYVIDSIQNSIADGKGGTILMFDIDKFKDYNDNYGHRYGDEILKKISEIMRGFFRSTDILGRYGGDEFVVFLPEFKNKVMVEKRLKSFVKLLSSLRGKDGERITVSVGAYIDDGNVTDVEKLIDTADRMVYHVKRKGGGDYEIK